MTINRESSVPVGGTDTSDSSGFKRGQESRFWILMNPSMNIFIRLTVYFCSRADSFRADQSTRVRRIDFPLLAQIRPINIRRNLPTDTLVPPDSAFLSESSRFDDYASSNVPQSRFATFMDFVCNYSNHNVFRLYPNCIITCWIDGFIGGRLMYVLVLTACDIGTQRS